MKNKNKFLLDNSLYIIVVILFLQLTACEKFVEIDPPKTQIASGSVFTDDATATSAIRGIYSDMVYSSGFMGGSSGSITHLSGLMSDELNNYEASLDPFYANQLIATNGDVKNSQWTPAYQFIYYANSIIEGLNKSEGVSPDVKKQLEGEAKFVRAICHFYLVNLFGKVPIVTTTDYKINGSASRSEINDVYDQVIEDLLSAQSLLSNDYSFALSERVRPNKWAATALLARAYLYKGDWENAELQSSQVINNTSLFNLADNLNDVFLMNSQESIWQLQPVQPSANTNEGKIFIPASVSVTTPYVSITNQLLNAFETGDMRKINWISSFTAQSSSIVYYYPYKYKVMEDGMPLSEYYTVLRLAEQYLIRAEARIQQNEISEGIDDLNVLRDRATDKTLPVNDPNRLQQLPANLSKEDALLKLEHERRIELFTEWGNRWFDLKRWNKADAILGLVKPAWDPTDVLLPIPQSERNNNPDLSQNNGY